MLGMGNSAVFQAGVSEHVTKDGCRISMDGSNGNQRPEVRTVPITWHLNTRDVENADASEGDVWRNTGSGVVR